MKALVGAFNQEKALVGAFSVIVQPVLEPMEHYTALTRTLAQLVGCDYKSDQARMVDCLRRIDPQVLINQEQSVSNYSLNMVPFPPVIDGHFLLEDPEILISNNIFKKCAMMIGTNANEGLSEMLEYMPGKAVHKTSW